MNKVPISLDTDALRSFVMGIESGSFATAAKYLCRSTSAVSAQLKKLEQQCGSELMVKQGRKLVPTTSGEMLLSYARRLLALNDEALLAVNGELLQGEVRLGMQEDFGESIMPDILGQFNRQHPGLRISARVDRNLALLQGIAAKELDMALIWQAGNETPDSRLIGKCTLEWIHNQQTDIELCLSRGEPLPLVMFDAPCLIRSRATAALDEAGIPWRIAFVSHSLSGIWAGVQAGLGITARTRIGMPTALSSSRGSLPSPGTLGISLVQPKHQHSDAIHLLQQLIVDTAQKFTTP